PTAASCSSRADSAWDPRRGPARPRPSPWRARAGSAARCRHPSGRRCGGRSPRPRAGPPVASTPAAGSAPPARPGRRRSGRARPVALAGEQPVAQAEGGACAAEALLLGVGGGALLRLLRAQAVQVQLRVRGVDLLALAGPGAALEVGRGSHGADHGQVEAGGELEVALVL